MVKRNSHLAKLNSGYLFPEIAKRKHAFLEKNPGIQLISLGIGDTTEPLPVTISQAISKKAHELATLEGYAGYGPEQGNLKLRQAISNEIYQGKIDPHEIFISDGAKCDIGRLQILFGCQATVAIQDPSYPVYVDTSVAMGQTGGYHSTSKYYENIVYMPCTPENDFFPDLDSFGKTDLIFFCSPNNPTGAAATFEQLEQLVAFAKKNRSIIIFDAAYASYIKGSKTPRSIFEIPGAEEVSIELGSFSKMAGFSGVRLGWSILPKQLKFEDGFSVQQDWRRIHATFFNGASNLAQAGGIAALEPEGVKAMKKLHAFYMENTVLLKTALEKLGYGVYGGIHAPYVWVKFPRHTSWEAFEMLLEKGHLISTPGIGFGSSGEGFVRLSAFGHRESILEAIVRLKSCL
jgi:LL-diaminopimelate aminotransferase